MPRQYRQLWPNSARKVGGQLRLLFNAAGILRTGAFVDIELEQHTRLVQIDVLACSTSAMRPLPTSRLRQGRR